MVLNEVRLSGDTIYDGKVVRVRRDRVRIGDGSEAWREVVDHPGGVVIAAVDDTRNIYIVEQFRYPMDEVVRELPAGKLEWDEEPLDAARRELREETGLCAGRIESLGVIYPTPGYSGEKLHLYLATRLTDGQQDLDEGELLRCRRMPLDEAVAQVLDNTIKDAKSAMLILLADRAV